MNYNNKLSSNKRLLAAGAGRCLSQCFLRATTHCCCCRFPRMIFPPTASTTAISLGQGQQIEGEGRSFVMGKMKSCVMPTIRNTLAKVNDLERKISKSLEPQPRHLYRKSDSPTQSPTARLLPFYKLSSICTASRSSLTCWCFWTILGWFKMLCNALLRP